MVTWDIGNNNNLRPSRNVKLLQSLNSKACLSMSEDLQRRSKTALACETCRRRKSRCDGHRPTCSHCVSVGAECHYRKLPSTVESDSALMARLAAVEARLDALDEGRHASSPRVANTHNSPASMQSLYDRMPEFHHGASHKILQYWSRLRVNLTIPDVEVLTFLRNTEDKALFVEPTPTETMKTTLPVSLATDCLRCWETHVSQLPVSFAVLLRTAGTWFSTDRIVALCEAQRFGDEFLHLNSLSVSESLIYAIAMRWAQDPLGPEVANFCFRMVLQRLWRVQMEADLVVVPVLLVVAHLFLYAYAMPFQALAILQIIDPVLTRLFEAHDHLDMAIVSFTQVFYVLQSDLLAEVDGLPSKRLPSLLPHSEIWPSALISNVDDASDAGFFVANLWLRSCLNRSLGQLYTTDQAYCQPQDAYPIISEIIVQLERWYRALPVELQFVRDARTFQLLMPPLSTRMKELSLRYHACIFVLHRPVLYSVLYQGIENSTTTLSDTAAELDRHLESRTIVACCDCIESAKLIILTLARHIDLPNQEEREFFPARHNWCDIQLLVGSYAVLLSVQTAPSFSLHFRDITRIGDILDLAEEILSSVAPSSQGYATTLDILLNIRSNFQGGFPCGFFIAESGVVAALTNITTVTQFRPVDHALGGSGAPLMQYLDFVAVRNDGPTVTLNIGGIANLQLANADRSKMMAFDTGPGNVMIDHIAKVRTTRAYDKDGELAAAGQVIQPLLEELQGHPFFERKPPRSAWRLDFGSQFADHILQRYVTASIEDLLTTVTMSTAIAIERALNDFILPRTTVAQVVSSGGGTRNTTLMRILGERVATHGLRTTTSDEFGMPPAYKEAIKFATLGFAAKRGLANNIPAAGGASSFAVLGKMTLAPRVAKGIEAD